MIYKFLKKDNSVLYFLSKNDLILYARQNKYKRGDYISVDIESSFILDFNSFYYDKDTHEIKQKFDSGIIDGSLYISCYIVFCDDNIKMFDIKDKKTAHEFFKNQNGINKYFIESHFFVGVNSDIVEG